MNTEFLSEAEIGARYPGEWVLVKNAEFDEQWRVTRGIVAAHSPEREVIDTAQQQMTEESGNLARLCFKKWPKDVAILL
ncbi:hypothetical protein EON83_01170 [bacterium]|nr:MAG: hypothetical protein EON83_01170 [bacterium]